MMDLAKAQEITARGMGVDRCTWNHAQQTALFRLQQGEGRPQAELVDWDEADDDEEDFVLDDRATYFVEANTGPGGPR